MASGVPELLSPGGSLEGIIACVNAGADAVYTGGSLFGARAYAKNSSQEQLFEALDYCHLRDRKLYLTVNTLLKEDELEKQLYSYLEPLYAHGLDAVLVQDLGVLDFIRHEFPDLPIHASTQMSVSCEEGARMLQELGCSRIVPARELSLGEISRIFAVTGMEIECFAHGALCYCYSGQCLMSSMIGGRSGNRGRCAQPCRQYYSVQTDNVRKNNVLKSIVQKNNVQKGAALADRRAGSRGRTDKVTSRSSGYLLSLKDICTLRLLPQMAEAGICSLKIEGRMKAAEYASGVTSIYRKYLDRLSDMQEKAGYDPADIVRSGRWSVEEQDLRDLMDLFNRGGFSEGYLQTDQTHSAKAGMICFDRPGHQGTEAARVLDFNRKGIRAQALEDLGKGDTLEIPDSRDHQMVLRDHVSAGEVFRLPGFMGAGKGQTIRRIRNEALCADIRKQWIDTENCVFIKGIFTFLPGKEIILEVICGDEKVSAGGPVPQSARTRALSEMDVRGRLEKCGGTGFAFSSLEIRMEEGLFLPVGEIAKIRREALTAMRERLISGFFRVPGGPFKKIHQEIPCGISLMSQSRRAPSDIRLRASADTPMQVRALSGEPSLEGIILDCQMFMEKSDHKSSGCVSFDRELYMELMELVRRAGKKCLLSLPQVWRRDIIDSFHLCFTEDLLEMADGFLLRNFQQLPEFSGRADRWELTADNSIYSWNHLARERIQSYGATDTLPWELSRREWQQLGCMQSEMVVYGRTLLMTSSQCIKKNTSGCAGKECVVQIRDRKNMVFPVRCRCGTCTNLIYNSLPMDLSPAAQEVKSMGARHLRLAFTVEEPEETRRIAGHFRRVFCEDETGDTAWKEAAPKNDAVLNATRGHFRRGVE